MSKQLIVSAQTKQTELKPSATNALLDVTVTNFKGKPLIGDKIIFESKKNKKRFVGVSQEKGKFSILLPREDTYNIKFQSFDDATDYNTLEIPGGPGLVHSAIDIQLEYPTNITLKNVLFDTGLASLKPSSLPSLNELASFMKLKTTMQIEIAGHTDNVGSAESNLKLSQQRAETVRNYLIKQGITETRITAKGYGDSIPVADNGTEAGKKQNRRTEVRVTKE